MDQTAIAGRIDVISDAICPWCYIGKRQLEKALAGMEKDGLRFAVAWHPFQLNPDMPAEGVDRLQYRIAKFGGAERAKQLLQQIDRLKSDLQTEITGGLPPEAFKKVELVGNSLAAARDLLVRILQLLERD